MDILEKNWKHHVSVGVASILLGVVSDKLLKHKTLNVSSAGSAVMTFVTVCASSAAADYGMSMMKDKR